MTASRSQRYVLAALADSGPIISDAGQAVPVVAAALGISTNNASNLIKRLADVGMVERDVRGTRTHRLALTHAGREELLRTVHEAPPPPRTVAPPPPAMPVCGPIGRRSFDAEAARSGAGRAAYL